MRYLKEVTSHHMRGKAIHDRAAVAFGKQIRDRRIQLNMSISRAATLSGISWSGWKSIEEGNATTVLNWFKVAEVLEWDLFIDAEEKEC